MRGTGTETKHDTQIQVLNQGSKSHIVWVGQAARKTGLIRGGQRKRILAGERSENGNQEIRPT